MHRRMLRVTMRPTHAWQPCLLSLISRWMWSMILQLICNEPLIFHSRICNIIIWIIVVGFQTKLCACHESLPNIISLGLILLQIFGHIVYPVFIHYATKSWGGTWKQDWNPTYRTPTVDTNYNNGQFQNSRLSFHSLQNLSNPWTADTLLLHIMDSFCTPNCTQTASVNHFSKIVHRQ